MTVWEREKIATIQCVPTLGKSSVWCLARSALTEPFSTSGVGDQGSRVHASFNHRIIIVDSDSTRNNLD